MLVIYIGGGVDVGVCVVCAFLQVHCALSRSLSLCGVSRLFPEDHFINKEVT